MIDFKKMVNFEKVADFEKWAILKNSRFWKKLVQTGIFKNFLDVEFNFFRVNHAVMINFLKQKEMNTAVVHKR